jgi:four helix bundle protein
MTPTSFDPDRIQVRDYRDLLVWQRAAQLTVECYRIARLLPREEGRELAWQLRSSSLSVSSNIAEGNGRFSTLDYLRFLSMSNGSLKEAGSQLYVARGCGFVSMRQVARAIQLSTDTGQLLVKLAQSLRRSVHR